jgi:hypothetical protein
MIEKQSVAQLAADPAGALKMHERMRVNLILCVHHEVPFLSNNASPPFKMGEALASQSCPSSSAVFLFHLAIPLLILWLILCASQ